MGAVVWGPKGPDGQVTHKLGTGAGKHNLKLRISCTHQLSDSLGEMQVPREQLTSGSQQPSRHGIALPVLQKKERPGHGDRTRTPAGHSDPSTPFYYNTMPFMEELCDLIWGPEDQLVSSIIPHHPDQRPPTRALNPSRDGKLITSQGSFLSHLRQH